MGFQKITVTWTCQDSLLFLVLYDKPMCSCAATQSMKMPLTLCQIVLQNPRPDPFKADAQVTV